MKITYSPALLSDAWSIVHAASVKNKEVNVPEISEEIQARNLSENVALEDIERLVLKIAEECHAPLVFTKLNVGLIGEPQEQTTT